MAGILASSIKETKSNEIKTAYANDVLFTFRLVKVIFFIIIFSLHVNVTNCVSVNFF